MSIKSNSGLRRVISLAAFTALIAAVTMAFADAPATRSSITLTKAEPALSTSPLPIVRLAEAKARKTRASSAKASVKTSAKASAKTTTKSRPTSELTGTLNINTASASELTKLPGIGPKKAALIIKWRAKHGRFGRVVDLRRVKGFGAKSVKKLRPYLSISGKNSLE